MRILLLGVDSNPAGAWDPDTETECGKLPVVRKNRTTEDAIPRRETLLHRVRQYRNGTQSEWICGLANARAVGCGFR